MSATGGARHAKRQEVAALRHLHSNQSSREELRRQLEEQQKEIEDLREQLAKREKQLAEREKQIADAGKQIADLERQLALRKQNSTNSSNLDFSSNPPGERGRWEQVTDSGRDRRLAVAGERKTVCVQPGGASRVSVSLLRQLRQAS